ncbi:hypothetical protein LTR62_001592 [Meristemomyces frigidus]|uniref:PSP1 C-terminal domain-containing protein n=1 Tax=Meristemomyces frigidus TaxID=1508187 RepID=A0AAN7YB80_9PEZI|nr:hypothetical protein LTR62_001592 [Meristemomyces frigidus]
MNSIRRGGTPESDAVVSSEDERPWPSSTSFGSLPRKDNGMPGLGGGIWSNNNQRRGSLKLSEAAQRNAAREARLTAPASHSALRTANTPSPAVSDGPGALPFAIPLQPTPKTHRSLSHSQGQREALQAHIAEQGHGGGALPLGLLAEDNETDADVDSDFGGRITQTVSHPPIGALQRAATYSAAYNGLSGMDNGGNEYEDRRLHAALSQLTMEAPNRKARWESHLGWGDLPNINESRRHSLADIPTRRGSFSEDTGYAFSRDQRPAHARVSATTNLSPLGGRGDGLQQDYQQHTNMRYNDDPEAFNIPQMYKVPYVEIKANELSGSAHQHQQRISQSQVYGAQSQRKNRQLYVVSFKCSRVAIFYLLEGTGLEIREGDIVIVEADRGQDLGTVQHATVTQEQARIYLRKYAEEQYKWLMMFSVNNAPSNVNPNAQLYGENNAGGASRGMLASAPNVMQGMPRENTGSLKPKAIKRLANSHEIKMLAEKEGNEAKAKRACQQKVAHLHLQMEILDAEWQWDFQKLIFYYYADHYINFKDLITELYRIYKTRIWLSAVNPASFQQQAMGQPPLGIGPGAITAHNGGANNSYTMTYGADPDPYGAIPPYRVGYDTYDPNYPSIPGVPNSFAPPINANAPSMPPGTEATGSMADYDFYYERNANAGQQGLPPSSATSAQTPLVQEQQQMQQYLQKQGTPYDSIGYWSGVFPGYPTQLAPQSPAGGVALPLRNHFSPSPWHNTSSPINHAATGPGRHTEVPAPIGTRPKFNGGPVVQNPLMRNVQGDVAADYTRQYRPQQEVTPYENQLRAAGFPFLPPMPAQAGMRNNGLQGNGLQGQLNGNTLNNPATANATSWPRKQPEHQTNEGAERRPSHYADEMSRER